MNNLFKALKLVILISICISCKNNANVGNESNEEITKSIEDKTLKITPPYFEVIDINGDLFTNSNLSDKKKVLIFTSAECGSCAKFYPYINKYNIDFSKEYQILVFQHGSNFEQHKSFKEKNNYGFHIFEADEETFINFQIETTPTVFLLDKDNSLLSVGTPENYADLVKITITDLQKPSYNNLE